MNKKYIKNDLLSDGYYEIDHDSGLKIFVMEKPEYTGAFAMFGTKYGSIDTCFRLENEKDFTCVPEGIAHFLEHKLFESEELDAFELFAKTGANANAFTSFDRTCYLFSCSSNFEKSLEILLDFVKKPYFTEQTVQKEQGIIGQEIRMYQDDPDWQTLFNLLRGLYKNNPVRIDIAGTIESIAEINAKLLYGCYNTFYNLSNMALAVAGNVSAEKVLEIADRVLPKEKKVSFEQIIPTEDESVVTAYTEEKLGVDITKFALGFKESHSTPLRTPKELACMNLALGIIAGKVSGLYCRLLEEGLINQSFGTEYFTGRGFAVPIFTGESNDPKKVRDEIILEIKRLRENGVTDEDFETVRKRRYGLEVLGFNETENLANALIDSYFGNFGLFDTVEAYKTVTKEEVEETLRTHFDENNCCLSVVK